MDINMLLAWLAGLLGVDEPTLLMILAVVVAVSNLVGRLIPDDATGFLGLVRKITKVLGLYLSNRVTSGVTVNHVAKTLVGARPDEVPGLAVDAVQEGVLDLIDEADEQVPMPKAQFLGEPDRDSRGRFKKSQANSPAWVGGIALGLTALFLLLTGCATTGVTSGVTREMCERRASIESGLLIALARAESIADSVRREAALGSIRTSLAALSKCPVEGV